MLVVRFDFTTGRYHATPWGSHVNEGTVEWPPSPWRFLRALIAVGYSRLGWTEVPAAARILLHALATVVPSYHLPRSNGAHTRHYMPLYNGDPTKVFDTFAYVGSEPLALSWEVSLDGDALATMDALLDALPYLGRAESAVSACRVDAVPSGLRMCIAAETCPGPQLERVALLAPEVPEVYDAWRAGAVARASADLLAAAMAKAAEKGKKAPKTPSKKELERLDEIYPRDVIEVLHANTRTLQAYGWSQPPGSRWLSYWRPADALNAATVRDRRPDRTALPTTALLALTSDTNAGVALPPITDAVRRMEALHDALVRATSRDGNPSSVLIGKEDGIPLRGHRHASLIPLALGRRPDRIDHVLVHAPMGFDAGARRALGAVTKTYAKDLPPIFVTLVGIGQSNEFERLVPCARASKEWTSRTPFVLPRHPKQKGKDTVEGQLQAELAGRGLPAAIRIEPVDGMREDFRRFRRERGESDRKPPVSFGHAVRLVFDEPVRGPIALGYGSHYGLGCFDPVT